MSEKKTKGLIQVYTGDGKGKTTAALGQAMRAAGRGLKVCFIQFLKSEPTGEHLFLRRYPAFEIHQTGAGNNFTKPETELKKEAQQTLTYAAEQMLSGKCDLLVLDEILVAINKELISTARVLELLDKKPESLEMVLTGRNAPPEIVQRADLVTEMLKIKHPYDNKIIARRGIEY